MKQLVKLLTVNNWQHWGQFPKTWPTATLISKIFSLFPIKSAISQAEISSKLNNNKLNKITSAEAQLDWKLTLLKFHVICPFTTFKSTKELPIYNELEKCAFEEKVSKQHISVFTAFICPFWLISWLR